MKKKIFKKKNPNENQNQNENENQNENKVILDNCGFLIKDYKIQPAFEPKTVVVLKKTYVNSLKKKNLHSFFFNNPYSKFLVEGEYFSISRCGMAAYPSILQRKESDRIDQKKYCSVEILNYFDFDDFSCITTVVRAEDLREE